MGSHRQDIGTVSDKIHSLEKAIITLQQGIQDIRVETENFKVGVAQQSQLFQTQVQAEMLTTQNSLSSAIAVASQQSSGPHSRSSLTLDADKRLQTIVKISGDESFTELNEWYTKAYIKLESVMPGSKPIFDWAIASSEEINTRKIDKERMEDRINAHRLNRELVSWMTGVIEGKAWTHARHVDPSQGLEAWRQVAQNLLRQGPMQLSDEFSFLLHPPPMTKKETIHLWVKAWETRADKLAAASSAHAFNPEFRKDIFYKSLPKEVKDMVDSERIKGELKSYNALREWIMSLGNNAALTVTSGPQQKLLLNALEDETVTTAQSVSAPANPTLSPEYTSEEWVGYMCIPERAEFARSNTSMPQVMEALLAMNQAGKGGKFGGGQEGRIERIRAAMDVVWISRGSRLPGALLEL